MSLMWLLYEMCEKNSFLQAARMPRNCCWFKTSLIKFLFLINSPLSVDRVLQWRWTLLLCQFRGPLWCSFSSHSCSTGYCLTHVNGWKFHKVENIAVPKELFGVSCYSRYVCIFSTSCASFVWWLSYVLPHFEGNRHLISRRLPHDCKPV